MRTSFIAASITDGGGRRGRVFVARTVDERRGRRFVLDTPAGRLDAAIDGEPEVLTTLIELRVEPLAYGWWCRHASRTSAMSGSNANSSSAGSSSAANQRSSEMSSSGLGSPPVKAPAQKRFSVDRPA